MTTEYTSNVANAATNLMQNNYSNKSNSNVNKNDTAFSNVLDNTYAKNTKDVKAAKESNHNAHNASVENGKSDRKTNRNATKNRDAETTLDDKTVSEKTRDSKTDTQNKGISETLKHLEENTKLQSKTDETSSEKPLLIEDNSIPPSTVEETENTEITEQQTEETTDTTENTDVPAPDTKAVSQQTTANLAAMANEPILANVDFTASQETDETVVSTANNTTKDTMAQNAGVKADSLKDVNIDLSKIINKLTAEQTDSETSQTTVSTQTSQTESEQTNNNVKTVTNGMPEVSDDIQVKVDTASTNPKPGSDEYARQQISKSITHLNERWTVTIEDGTQESVSSNNITNVTPTDTESENTPVIKATDAAVAQAKENSINLLDGKNIDSNVKDKAISQMTAAQNTDTTVTDTQTNADTGSDSSLSKNANEMAAKMSVKDASSEHLTGSESFINRLEQNMNSNKTAGANIPAKELSKGDILSQTNKLFENMQQTNNGKVSIVLRPENLGRVSLEIMNTKEGIVARMSTDNQQVKELFDKNMDALKSSLNSQGVNVNNIKVECTQESSNNAMNFERDQFNQNTSKDSQGNRQNQTGNAENSYGSKSDADMEFSQNTEFKNEETIIQHNGKVDYKV